MRISGVVFLVILATVWTKDCPSKRSSSKLFCYYSKLSEIDNCYCSHVILPANADVKSINKARGQVKGAKILITVNEFNQGLIDTLKNTKVDGLEINLKKLDSKHDINDFISTIRTKLGSDLYIVLSVPSKAEILAKYYDFKGLSKHADLFILQTAFLGASKNVTFHPSRLSGLWDMQNTDSVVDLVSGLGAPVSKLVITAPVQAFQFTLQSEEYTAPGSPALKVKSLTRNELCNLMNGGANWTLERDQDQAGPYIFSKDQWIAFEDSTSMDIKAKYSRVRGLAGIALMDVSQDGGDKCGPSILETAYNGLSRQARAPRGAVLHSLEREILETPTRHLDSVHVSPYRISRVIDVEGKLHDIRHDTRTEFECSRQGYFVHPRSCNRFYRCVKFDQLVDDFNVFEFDCPAGLAFDERVEVCVWPGSLKHGTPCSGSSEIAPVPRERFVCPSEPGYYADPENCRWFFACMDHGKSPLTAYEFRCPFGLVFDSERLLCEWSWLVPKCANGIGLGIDLSSEFVYGGIGKGTGVILEQYHGLGVLGTVQLGGISGRIEQPVAKIYSNVGTAGLGYQNGAYINQDGYIIGGGLNGLGNRAVQSLHNAGLLRSDLAAGTGQIYEGALLSALSNKNEGFGLKHADISNVGTSIIGVQELGTANLNAATNFGTKTSGTNVFGVAGNNVNTQYISGVTQGAALNIADGQKLIAGDGNDFKSQSFLQYNGNGQIGLQNVPLSPSGLNTIQVQTTIDANLNDNLGATFGSKFSQGGGETSFSNTQFGHEGQKSVQGTLGNLNYITSNANDFGAKSTQSFIQYHGPQEQVIQQGGFGHGDVSAVHYQANLDNVANDFGARTSQISLHGQGQSAQVVVDNIGVNQVGQNIEQSNINLGSSLDYNSINNNFGAKTSQITQGDVNGRLLVNNAVLDSGNYQKGVSGNINIVGGGYSAVGLSKSGVEISSNGDNIETIIQSTPAPVTVTTISSIPTVSSVPIPALKTATGFESYNGGVIANVPELQYKLEDNTNLGNNFTNFVKYGTAPETLLVNEGYEYKKPAVSFIEGVNQNEQKNGIATSYSYQSLNNLGNNGGYVYQKPSVSFEDGQAKNVNYDSTYNYIGLSTVKPDIVSLKQNVITPTLSVETNGGYVYDKPRIPFEEASVKISPQITISSPTTVNFQPIARLQPVVQQSTVSTFTSNKQDIDLVNLNFQQPGVLFGEKVLPQVYVSSTPQPFTIKQTPQVYVSSTVAPIVEQKLQPVVSSGSLTHQINSLGYDYPKPSVTFEENPIVTPVRKSQPAIISRFSIRKPVVQPTISTYNQINDGYQYQKAAIIPTISAPVKQSAISQPASASYSYQQEFKSEGYQYPKPSVTFEENSVPLTYVQPIQKTVIQPAVDSTYQYKQPTVEYGIQYPTYTHQKPAVTSYTYQNVAQEAVFKGYSYPKPSITFEEKQIQPVVSSYLPATVKPVVQQPAVVSSYSYVAPSTPQPAVIFQKQPVTSSIVTPEIKPDIVSSYSYVTSSTPKPEILEQNQPVSTFTYSTPSTARPIVNVEKQPVWVSNYNYVPSTTSKPEILVQKQENADFVGYNYPNPAVSFVEEPTPIITSYENRQPIEEVPFVKKTAYVTGLANSFEYRNNVDNNYKQVTSPRPVVVENYQAPEYRQNSVSFLGGAGTPSTTPIYQQVYYSTQRPTFASTISSVISKTQVTDAPNFYYYDSRLSSTPKSSVETGYSYPKPEVIFEEKSVLPTVSSYSPVSTPTKEYLPVQTVTTSRPISKYSFSSLDDQYQYVSTPSSVISPSTPLTKVTPQSVFVVPEVSTVFKEYLPAKPKVRYSTTVRPIEVTSLAREYLPVRSRVKITTSTPSVEYLPARISVTTGIPDITTLSRDYLPAKSKIGTVVGSSLINEQYLTSKKPSKVTIIKQNDFHPILAAKLGAQCTCISNTLNLRKKQKIIIVEDDDDDDDGYAVGDNDQNGVVVENYQYEPQRTIDITPTPQIYLKSTTNEIIPAPTPTYTRKRVRVRPVTSTVAYEPVTEAKELFLRRNYTPVGTGPETVIDTSAPALVDFNANVRATIECHRAGLFRHPNQCNKFYSCRWDCTKNKFTLHVFNCPVHLTFDNSLGACNWPSQGPACLENTLLPSE